jgi:hypothetical protein
MRRGAAEQLAQAVISLPTQKSMHLMINRSESEMQDRDIWIDEHNSGLRCSGHIV